MKINLCVEFVTCVTILWHLSVCANTFTHDSPNALSLVYSLVLQRGREREKKCKNYDSWFVCLKQHLTYTQTVHKTHTLTDPLVPVQYDYWYFKLTHILFCRSQWPRGLRHRSAAARLLRLWVRIPPGGMDACLLWVLCRQVEVSATDWTLVQRSPTDCGASCVIKNPRTRGG
jgi:hypothetical protein